jgi:hypothetical protein
MYPQKQGYPYLQYPENRVFTVLTRTAQKASVRSDGLDQVMVEEVRVLH